MKKNFSENFDLKIFVSGIKRTIIKNLLQFYNSSYQVSDDIDRENIIPITPTVKRNTASTYITQKTPHTSEHFSCPHAKNNKKCCNIVSNRFTPIYLYHITTGAHSIRYIKNIT